MALTRITKGVIKPNENYDTHNINSTGIITATGFVGPVTGAITGTASLASGLTGTPDIAVRNITGVGATFTGNVSIGGTLTYEDVTNIDSVGIVTAREGIFLPDNKKATFGAAAGGYLEVYNSGSDSFIKSHTDDLWIYGHDNIFLAGTTSNHKYLRTVDAGGVFLYHNNSVKFETTSSGISVTGTVAATSFSGDGSNLTGISSPVTVDSYHNIFGGTDAGASLNSSSHNNVLFGQDAGDSITSGYENICIGLYAGQALTSEDKVIAIGSRAGQNFNASDSVFIGWNAGSGASANGNTCLGYNAGTEANGNDTAVGYSAGPTGSYSGNTNVCYGFGSGNGIRQNASRNTIIGPGAGKNASTGQVNIEGSDNIIIGSEASLSSTTVSNECVIGALEGHSKAITNFRIPGTKFVVNTVGVLIGTTATSNAESFRIHTSDSGKAIIKLTNSTTGTAAGDGFEFGMNANEEIEFVNKENTDMFFATNTTERLRIHSTGELQIGDSTKSSLGDRLLQVGKTNRSATYIEVRTSTTGVGGIVFSDGTASNDSGYRGTIEYDHGATNTDDMFFKTAAVERLRIASDGRVQVKNGSLDLGTADTSSGHINSAEVLTFNIDTDNDDTNRYFAFYKNGSDGSGTELLKIEENGTTTASGTSDGVLQLDTSDSRGAFVRFGQGGSYHHMIGCADGLVAGPDKEDLGLRAKDNMVFCTNGASEKLRIDSHGCVRVGNTATQTTSGNTKRIALGAKGSIQGWVSGQLNGLIQLTDNYYWDGSNNKAIEADHCAYLSLRSGSLRFGSTNSSQTAGANVSGGINERFRIDQTGRVLIGDVSSNKIGDSALQVHSSDRKHPAIRATSTSVNGLTLFGDAYKTDESQVNIGVSYSSASLVLSSGCKVSDTADDAYLSSQDTYSTRPCALRISTDGSLSFHTTETSATRTTDSAASITEVFNIDRVGNIRQKITGRFLYMGANQQLKIGVSGSDPLIDAVSGDLMIKNSDTTIAIVRDSYLQMTQNIRMNNDKGISFINADDTATGETVSSSVLDDYEEGSWTPDLIDGNGSNVTWSNGTNCRYVKVGRMVYCYFRVTKSETGSKTGAMRFYNLPYAATNSTFQITGTWWLDKGGVSQGDAVGGAMYVVENQRQAYFVYPTSTWQQASSRYLQFSEWTNLRPCYGAFTYEAVL